MERDLYLLITNAKKLDYGLFEEFTNRLSQCVMNSVVKALGIREGLRKALRKNDTCLIVSFRRRSMSENMKKQNKAMARAIITVLANFSGIGLGITFYDQR